MARPQVIPLPTDAATPPPAVPAAVPVPAQRAQGQLGFLQSLGHAYRGLLHACAQRNMKIHVVSAVLVGLVGSGIRLELAEKVTLIFCVMLIFFAEILNTALEALVDLHTEDFNNLAKITKDAAAASVLVLATGTVVIFAALVVYNWPTIVTHSADVFRQILFGVPLATLTGLLLSARARPAWVDHLLFGLAVANWSVLWLWTASWVFTTLTGLIVLLAWRASRQPGHHA